MQWTLYQPDKNIKNIKLHIVTDIKEMFKRWLPEEESKGLVVKGHRIVWTPRAHGRQDMSNPSKISKQLMALIRFITVKKTIN